MLARVIHTAVAAEAGQPGRGVEPVPLADRARAAPAVGPILKDIARALRISAETLYVRAGILDEQEPSDLEVGILQDPHLTERQKQVLIDVYRSFRNDGKEHP